MEYWDFKTVIEPFRIKSVEAIPLLTRAEREVALFRAGNNLFGLRAEEVTIDLLTDSGTGAMSSAQWAGLMIGDETYAGSRSYRRLDEVVLRITGLPNIFPVHQGRAAERILAATELRPGMRVLSNTHFDTTRANVEGAGAVAVDLPVPLADDEAPFKGDIDLQALEAALGDDVALVLMTVTNNAAGGQPVSMANLRAAAEICRGRGVPIWLDAARFAENAWFIHTNEPGFEDWSLPEIARAMFDCCDGFTMSAKKDGIVNIGGLLATRDAEQAARFQNELILGEGFPSYGGLAGRDLEAMAIGLDEALDPNYLRYRTRSIAYFAEGLQHAGVPVVRPPGGHAVYLDAGRLLPHVGADAFPGQSLGAALYLEGGVRGVEVGSLMLPSPPRELLRLAVPRRVYTQAHINYVVEVAARVVARAPDLRGFRIVEAPKVLRHFTARLEQCA